MTRSVYKPVLCARLMFALWRAKSSPEQLAAYRGTAHKSGLSALSNEGAERGTADKTEKGNTVLKTGPYQTQRVWS